MPVAGSDLSDYMYVCYIHNPWKRPLCIKEYSLRCCRYHGGLGLPHRKSLRGSWSLPWNSDPRPLGSFFCLSLFYSCALRLLACSNAALSANNSCLWSIVFIHEDLMSLRRGTCKGGVCRGFLFHVTSYAMIVLVGAVPRPRPGGEKKEKGGVATRGL